MKNIRVLIFGYPGTPILEVGEKLSLFHNMNYFTIENDPEEEDSYFRDKIPTNYIDTGDFVSGSGSSNMSRDVSSLTKDKELDSLYSPTIDTELDADELDELSSEETGILSTEVPDIDLLDWATHVLFFRANFDIAVDWFSKRRKCPTCGNVHHLEEKPPRYPGVCDRCGTGLILKPEDSPEIVSEIYLNWRRAFSVFETKARGKKHWKAINTDECKDFDEIVTKVDKWLKKTGLGDQGVSLTPRTDHKWFSRRN